MKKVINKIQEEKGITLIALVITIIVLIILAGISIRLLLGENGIITKAKKGKGDYEESAVREKVEMALVDYNSDKVMNGEEGEVEEALNKLLDNNTFDDIEIEENIGIIGDYEITLGKEKGEVIIDSIDKVIGTLRLRCKLNTKDYTNQEVTIMVKATGNATKVIKPDGTEVEANNGQVEFNYLVSVNGNYIFKATDAEGNFIEKTVSINNIDTLPPKAFNITAEQIDKKIVITANAEDTEATETLACSGIERYEYFVKKSTEESYSEMPYKVNEIEITEYGTYNIFVKAYDKAGNVKECNEEITIEIINPKVLKYGQKVNYSANGVGDWKIFYINEERNETFIITSGYLPNGTVPTTKTGITIGGTYGASWKTVPSYVEITNEVRDRFMIRWANNKTNDNIKCVSRLLDTNAWSDFVTDELKEKGATAIGSPTLEMFVNSWNDVYSNELLSVLDVGYNDYGYLINSNSSSTKSLQDLEGANNRLYIPYDKGVAPGGCFEYYLSSPSASTRENIITILSNTRNEIKINYQNRWANLYSGIRPVVCIPSNLLEYNDATSSWDINLDND